MGDARFSSEAVDDSTVVIAAHGELDLSNTAGLEEHVERALSDGHRRLVLDLAGVEYMDSTATSKVIAAHQAADAAGGRVVVVVPGGSIRRTLQVRGLDNLFEVAASRDEAMRVLGEGDA